MFLEMGKCVCVDFNMHHIHSVSMMDNLIPSNKLPPSALLYYDDSIRNTKCHKCHEWPKCQCNTISLSFQYSVQNTVQYCIANIWWMFDWRIFEPINLVSKYALCALSAFQTMKCLTSQQSYICSGFKAFLWFHLTTYKAKC